MSNSGISWQSWGFTQRKLVLAPGKVRAFQKRTEEILINILQKEKRLTILFTFDTVPFRRYTLINRKEIRCLHRQVPER
jgi:hypothetical protein